MLGTPLPTYSVTSTSAATRTAPPLARQFLDEMFVGMRETAFATAKRARRARS